MNRFVRLFVPLSLLCHALLLPMPAPAGPPPVEEPVGLDDLLVRGSALESAGQWQKAIELYEQALKRHPRSRLLRDKLWECRVHRGIARRYEDPSFTGQLVRLPQAKLVAFYSEVVTTIQENYYRAPDLAALRRAAFRSVLVALHNPVFRSRVLSQLSDQDIRELEQFTWSYLKDDPARVTRERLVYDALRYVRECHARWGIQPSALFLQLTFGLSHGLDKYTTCLTPKRLSDLYALIDGEFVGIGVELRGSDDGHLIIINVLPDSPAERAGLKKNDVIVAIDGVPIQGESVEQAADRLQGPEGSTVEVLVRRAPEDRLLKFLIVRGHVEVPSVERAEILSPSDGIGYVKLVAFQRTTVHELVRAVSRLRHQNLRGLILDLRGNPGGLLASAVDVADCFLDSGTIVTTSGRGEGQSWTYWARPAGTWHFPLVLLVDHDSASASEIVAGAIKEHRRGLIIGERTYGKGTVQSILPLHTVSAGLRLTTAEFLSPSGRSYSQRGVEPDIYVPGPKGTQGVESSGPYAAALRLTQDRQLAVALQKCRELVARRPRASQ